jgi:hypothetical protein
MAAPRADVIDVIEPEIALLFVFAVAIKALLGQQGSDFEFKKPDGFAIGLSLA